MSENLERFQTNFQEPVPEFNQTVPLDSEKIVNIMEYSMEKGMYEENNTKYKFCFKLILLNKSLGVRQLNIYKITIILIISNKKI